MANARSYPLRSTRARAIPNPFMKLPETKNCLKYNRLYTATGGGASEWPISMRRWVNRQEFRACPVDRG
ncbi:hypothetical protein ABIE91_000667 [Bradyrhizobium elkanii]